MIIRYTTPYHYFILPIKREFIDSVYITYFQNGNTVIDKNSNDDIKILDPLEVNNASFWNGDEGATTIAPDETFLTLRLTQEETSRFKFFPAAEKNIALIQVRVISTDGGSYVSRVIRDRIYGTLKEEVING